MLELHAFYKCPTCGGYLYSSSLHCGNTIGAKFYSDGKMFDPMWPEFPDFTKCKECGTIIMLSRLEWFLGSALELGFYECQPLTIGDLYRALDIFPEEELSIRLHIWRLYNDKFRYHADLRPGDRIAIDSIIDTDEYQNNCVALLGLLNRNNPDERILLAELNRNLGNFTECLDLIPVSKRNDRVEKILVLECGKGNRYTICIDDYYKNLEAQAEKKEQERINEEMKDPRWKICPNGHCYENIRKNCIWCGDDNVVGRLKKDIILQHRELYVGKQNGHYILTSDASIPLQEERIRKITIDYYQDKFIYFHMDGKNPHPFCFNTIKLNQGSIKGRTLTKLCEDILISKCNSVDLSSYIDSDILG